MEITQKDSIPEGDPGIPSLVWPEVLNPRNWETDLYTPPVLRGAALFVNSAPAV